MIIICLYTYVVVDRSRRRPEGSFTQSAGPAEYTYYISAEIPPTTVLYRTLNNLMVRFQ